MAEPTKLKIIEPVRIDTKVVNHILSTATVDGSVDLILGSGQFSIDFREDGRSDPEIVVCARLRMSVSTAVNLVNAIKSQIEMAAVPTEKAN